MSNPTKVTTDKDVVQSAKKNHIWLNSTNCINPTPEFCEQLGRDILAMLNQKSKLIPVHIESEEGEEVHPASLELATLTPTLYLSINKS